MEAVNPPTGLSDAGRRAWRFAADTLAAYGEDVATNAGAVERYARLIDQLALADAEWNAAGCPMTALGSAKQEQPHPLLKVQAELRRQALDLESALGLTVGSRTSMARRRGGPGVAHAADRSARPGLVVAMPRP
jgi:phage terminase small subunit